MLGHAGGHVVELVVLVVVYRAEVRHVVVDVGGAAVARLGALETLPLVEALDGRGQLLQPGRSPAPGGRRTGLARSPVAGRLRKKKEINTEGV